MTKEEVAEAPEVGVRLRVLESEEPRPGCGRIGHTVVKNSTCAVAPSDRGQCLVGLQRPAGDQWGPRYYGLIGDISDGQHGRWCDGRNCQEVVVNKAVVVAAHISQKKHGIGDKPRARGDDILIGIVFPCRVVRIDEWRGVGADQVGVSVEKRQKVRKW